MMDALIPKTFEQSLGLEECLHFYPLRKNRSVRFDFSGSTVLLASRGHSVSFNTTVGGDVLLGDKRCCRRHQIDQWLYAHLVKWTSAYPTWRVVQRTR